MGKKDEPKEIVVDVPPVEDVPIEPPGREMIWSVLSREQTEQLLALTSPAEIVRLLCELLDVHHYDINPRSRAWIDFCLYNIIFAKDEMHFDGEKLALFFAIMSKIFTHATTTIPSPSLEESYGLLKELLKKHSVDIPEEAFVCIFSISDVQAIVSYLTTTFYRHYKPYQMAFQKHPRFLRVVKTLVVETPMEAIPMAQAIEFQTVPDMPTEENKLIEETNELTLS